MSSNLLNPVFKVRFFNFQLDAPIATSRANPPYLLRVRVDDRPFNTKGHSSPSMRPIWDDDVTMEYVAPSIDQLATRYLTIECYGGGDTYLGSCRLTLHELATGPSSYHLDLRQGPREVGKLDFHCTFELISEVSIQLSRLRIDQLPQLGYDGPPNPYLAFHVGSAGDVRESSIAAGARTPEWPALPPVYVRGTYAHLCDQKLTLALKHCRNGFSVSHSDPTMAHAVIRLDRFAIEPRSCTIPFREVVHNDPGFPFPFSAEMSGVIEFRNVHPIMQLAAGVRQDSHVVGGVPAVGVRSGSSPTRNVSQQLPVPTRATSPPRHHRGDAAAASVNVSYVPQPQPSVSFQQSSYQHAGSYDAAPRGYVPPSQAASLQYNTSAPPTAPLPSVAPADLEVLDEVTHKQTTLLSKVEGRLNEIARRKTDVAGQLAVARANEEMEMEAASQRKVQLDSDLRNALLEKDRLEEHLRSIQLRREEESRIAVQQAAERERAKRALEEEQQEALAMQQRVVQLRNEMTRHLEEEEHRYQQRVREAEEARRRTQDDANALADLEARLAEAELRATVRQKEEYHRSTRRSVLSSPPRHR